MSQARSNAVLFMRRVLTLWVRWRARLPRLLAIGLLRLYRYTLSSLIGRRCRYLPTCSCYSETAIARHGLWAGGWMTLARLQRCRPGGASGYDPAPEHVAPHARWYLPWRYGQWTGAHMADKSRLDR